MIILFPKELKMEDFFKLKCNFIRVKNTDRLCVISNKNYYCYTYNDEKNKFIFKGIIITGKVANIWLYKEKMVIKEKDEYY